MSARKLNCSMLVWTVASLIALALGVHLLHGAQASRHAQLLRQQAEDAQATGESERATSLWGRYLQLAPDDGQGLAQYADLLERSVSNRTGRWRVIGVWRAVLDQDPSNQEARVRLAKLLIEQSAYPEARKHLEILMTARPADGSMSVMYGRSLEALSEFDQAAAAYENAIRLSPDDLEAYQRLAAMLIRRQQSMKVAEVVAGRADVCRALIRVLIEWGRFAEADEAISQLQLHSELSRNFRRLAADIALRAGNSDRAVTLARSAVAEDSADYRDHLWLGRLLARAGRRHAAEEAFRRAVQLASHSVDAWIALAGLLADADQTEMAEAVLADAARSLPSDARLLAAAMGAEALHQWRQAEAGYQKALAAQPDDPLVLLRAVCFYLRIDQPGQAEPLLRRLFARPLVLSKEELAWARRQLAMLLTDVREAHALLDQDQLTGQPESVATRRARAFVDSVQPDKRASSLLLLQSLAPNTMAPDEQLRLARLAMSVNDWPTAREQMLDLLARDKTNPAYLTQFTQWLLELKNVEEAEMWLARLEKAVPSDPRAVSLRERLAAVSLSGAH
jgi:tetratricopeptide (TPR) repeat protein